VHEELDADTIADGLKWGFCPHCGNDFKGYLVDDAEVNLPYIECKYCDARLLLIADMQWFVNAVGVLDYEQIQRNRRGKQHA
tara:strand:- start:599 stop:844 length:246 start_codon:yes stop_codon:yes gene_type:complete